MWGSESSRFQSDWAASPTSFTTCCIHSSPHKLALILTHGFHWQMLHGSGLSNILRSPLQLRLNFPQWLLRACMQGFWYWHEVPSHSYSDPLNAEFFLPSKPAPWEQPLLIAKALWKLEMTPPLGSFYVVFLRKYNVPIITMKEEDFTSMVLVC